MTAQRGQKVLVARRLAAALTLACGGAAAAAEDASFSSMLATIAAWNRAAPGRHARLADRRAAAAGRSAAPAMVATGRTVTNCNDAGAGSLRAVVAASASGDTVDMSLLNCSPITLTTGAIQVTQNNLTVLGKTQQSLAIDGSYSAAIFEHKGTGTLAVSDVTLRHGYYGRGGCIYSKGSLALTRVTVSNCKVVGYGGYAAGGGVFATNDLTLTSSSLIGNKAYDGTFSGANKAFGAGAFAGRNAVVAASTVDDNNATSGAPAAGGGLYVIGTLNLSNSTIGNNTALQVLGNYGLGGGVFVGGTAKIVATTIQGNNARLGAGVFAAVAANTLSVTNSTITNNDGFFAAGIFAYGPLKLGNSTVARNYAGGNQGGAGVFVHVGSTFQSSLVASNYAGQGCTQKCAPTNVAADLSSAGVAVTITGANNLVTSASPAVTLPGDTLTADPLLDPFLENNGGPTQTMGLKPGSPAIDKGSNPFDLAADQRGAPFCRKVGSKPDIGAFEVQPAGSGCTLIFADGFEALP